MDGYKATEVMDGVVLYTRESNTFVDDVEEESKKSEEDLGLELKTVLEMMNEKINSLHHLIRSNKEMQEFIDNEFDEEIKEAIDENRVIIDEYKQIIIRYKNEIFENYHVSIPLPSEVEDCSEGIFV